MPPLTIQPLTQTSGELLYLTSLFESNLFNQQAEGTQGGIGNTVGNTVGGGNSVNSALSGRKINLLDLPEGLHAWLNGKEDVSGESQGSKVVGSNSGSFNSNNKLEIIRRARMTTKELHQRRLKFLSTSLACMGSYSQHRVLLSKQELQSYTRNKNLNLQKSHKKLENLTLSNYEILKNQLLGQKLELQKTLENLKILETLQQHKQTLNLLSHHLPLSTRSSVTLRLLPVGHPQEARCNKAATENVKKSFKGKVNVHSVWKIENRNLLDAFQAGAEVGGKVKGLFCTIPPTSLPHLICHGMSPATNVLHSSPQEAEIPTASYVSNLLANSNPVKFPRNFSRHSTLSDRGTGVQFLALCRVLVNKVTVVKQGYSGEGDAIYNSVEEEYRLNKGGNVLPEFVICYTADEGAKEAGGGGGGKFEVDKIREEIWRICGGANGGGGGARREAFR
ncbi:hypothetical protein TrLO_g7952 [Triparma laevis f. longispina]|uniref:Uncharacterized protein n=1 Tax=Triparma laevis f. longispina TaxID=1714387 RepID=A0A9W7FJ10_9STRA|nr:hypothetical protein TrLO_g7952 [Triparma laevis f. longispina]